MDAHAASKVCMLMSLSLYLHSSALAASPLSMTELLLLQSLCRCEKPIDAISVGTL